MNSVGFPKGSAITNKQPQKHPHIVSGVMNPVGFPKSTAMTKQQVPSEHPHSADSVDKSLKSKSAIFKF